MAEELGISDMSLLNWTREFAGDPTLKTPDLDQLTPEQLAQENKRLREENRYLKDQPPPQGLNEVWVADITYIPVGDTWMYLAALMDLKSRMIVGWALEDHMKSSLIGKTLDQALACRLPAPGLVHHSVGKSLLWPRAKPAKNAKKVWDEEGAELSGKKNP